MNGDEVAHELLPAANRLRPGAGADVIDQPKRLIALTAAEVGPSRARYGVEDPHVRRTGQCAGTKLFGHTQGHLPSKAVPDDNLRVHTENAQGLEDVSGRLWQVVIAGLSHRSRLRGAVAVAPQVHEQAHPCWELL